MAEVIGVVSGAITFATVVVQVGNCITTLKHCWDQFHDAPEDLQKMIHEIELFGLILSDIEQDLAEQSSSSALETSRHAQLCFALSKEAVQDLEILCKDLMRNVTSGRLRRSYMAMKMTMHMSNLEKHRSRLQNIIRLLILSQQCYTRTLVQIQPKLIANGLARHEAPFEMSKISETIENARGDEEKAKMLRAKRMGSASSSTYAWRFSLPSWMTSKVLEVAGMRAPGGWNWTLRAYNEIPFTAKAVQSARCGDIKGLQDLFSSGQASPFDRVDFNGYTLLHYADGQNREDVLAFLLAEGADASVTGHRPFSTPLQWLIWSKSGVNRDKSMIPSMRVLLGHSEDLIYETAEETMNGVLCDFHGTAEEFVFLQQRCCPNFYQLPFSARVALATKGASVPLDPHDTPDLVRTILREDKLEAEGLQFITSSPVNSRQITLVSCVARKMGWLQALLTHISQSKQAYGVGGFEYGKQKRRYDLWSTLFREFLSAGVKLHHIVDGKTPFVAFLQGYFDRRDGFEEKSLTREVALRAWLRELATAGVDFRRFGEMEKFIWTKEVIHKEFPWMHDLWTTQRVVGFTYGSTPEDWHIWLSEGSDSFAGDFWDLIERPTQSMPGEWPDQ